MENNRFNFDINDCRVTALNFSINKEFEPGPDIPLDINMEMEHDYFDDKDILRLAVRSSITGEGSPFSLSAEIGGLFHFTTGKPDTIRLQRIAEINCAAILFPFLRETIADIIRRSGLPTLLLPPMNFEEFYLRNHPEE